MPFTTTFPSSFKSNWSQLLLASHTHTLSFSCFPSHSVFCIHSHRVSLRWHCISLQINGYAVFDKSTAGKKTRKKKDLFAEELAPSRWRKHIGESIKMDTKKNQCIWVVRSLASSHTTVKFVFVSQ